MRVGYARVSTDDQNFDMQTDALRSAGCERIFEEKASGGNDTRPVLKEALEFLRPGDTIVVWKIDRFARSTAFFVRTIDELTKKGIWFESITESSINTTPGEEDPFKEAMRGILAIFAQLDRKIINQRIREGRKAARARGRIGGRPKHPVLSDPRSLAIIMETYDKGDTTVAQICKLFKIASQNTFYLYRRKWLQERGLVSETP